MIFAVPVGIILFNLNRAGIFDNAKLSLRLLVKTINDFRRYNSDDMKYLQEEEQEGQEQQEQEEQEGQEQQKKQGQEQEDQEKQ